MTIQQAAEDIRSMRIRGAAKIGRHAAAALGRFADGWRGDLASLEAAAETLVKARPTAVSLPNAVHFVVGRARTAPEGQRQAALRQAAQEFDERAERALAEIGRHGAALVPEGGSVLTICNSQGALTPLFEAKRQGKAFQVIALETRPWRQGLLTVGQLAEQGIPCSLAVDSAAWQLLPQVSLVLTGADSLAQNGDVLNKVGTGGLGILARERGVPLYVCAETYKVHPLAARGEDVPIEEREAVEVVKEGEVPAAVGIRNPVFDVTPARCVRGYVTELGVLKPEDLVPAWRKAWS